MQGSKAHFTAPALLIALATALPLAGCETASDPLATIVTDPGQYDLYDCPAIKVAAIGINSRRHELEGLMARADRGPAGGFISATTYQPEYVTLRGKMRELRSVAAQKHCGFDPATVKAAAPPPAAKQQAKPAKRRRGALPGQ